MVDLGRPFPGNAKQLWKILKEFELEKKPVEKTEKPVEGTKGMGREEGAQQGKGMVQLGPRGLANFNQEKAFRIGVWATCSHS